jgi:hypothetical protein
VFLYNSLKQKGNQAMAHSSTTFSQLLQLVSRHDFRRIEEEGFKFGRKPRSLTRWGQFVAMMFAHLTARSSLRDIASQLGAQTRRLYHLGVRGVKRFTLSDANQDRPAEFFESVFHHLYAKCSAVAPKKRFRFKCKLYSFDSTVVDLCLSLFPRARFRKNKGGIKLHTLLDHDGHSGLSCRSTFPSSLCFQSTVPLTVSSIQVTLPRRFSLAKWRIWFLQFAKS